MSVQVLRNLEADRILAKSTCTCGVDQPPVVFFDPYGPASPARAYVAFRHHTYPKSYFEMEHRPGGELYPCAGIRLTRRQALWFALRVAFMASGLWYPWRRLSRFLGYLARRWRRR